MNFDTIQEAGFFQDNFFVIDSKNLSSVKPKLYGYAVTEEDIFINTDKCNRVLSNDTCGVYINIIKAENECRIYQDYFGCYGLYLYEKDDYFAISNSFLYLVYYLKSIVKLSINSEYMKAFIARPQASLVYEETMVNEIRMLPRNCFVTIKIDTKRIELTEVEQKESYIDINTIEGMHIIDMWHQKWNSIFSALTRNNEQVMLKLSGGKDSRISLACMFSPRVKHMERISFFSAHDNLYTHGDDYRIACQLASIYSFDIETTEAADRYRVDPVINLKSSLYAKAGFHREICLTNFWRNKTRFTITGSGGDLRDLWTETAEEFIKKNVDATVFHSIDSGACLQKQLNKTVEIISNKNPGAKLIANDYFYKQGRQRNHNGKAMVESFLGNEVVISPLLDPMLYKLNQSIGKENDNDLIYAIILQRFLPEAEDIGFDSDRIIQPKTKLVAKQINDLFSYDKSIVDEENIVSVHHTARVIPVRAKEVKDTALDVLNKIFKSDDLKKVIYEELGEEAYIWAEEYYKRSYHSYIAAAAIVEIYIILKAVKDSFEHLTFNSVDLPYNAELKISASKNYFNDGVMLHIYRFLSSLRLECKNIGLSGNNISLENNSEEGAFFEVPKWLCDSNGNGFLLQLYSGKCALRLKAICDGVLNFKLKGAWLKDLLGKAVPINIDVTKFILKKENVALFSCTELFTVNSIAAKQFEISCKNGDSFDIELEWRPYYYNENDLKNLLHTMRLVNLNYYLFWDKK